MEADGAFAGEGVGKGEGVIFSAGLGLKDAPSSLPDFEVRKWLLAGDLEAEGPGRLTAGSGQVQGLREGGGDHFAEVGDFGRSPLAADMEEDIDIRAGGFGMAFPGPLRTVSGLTDAVDVEMGLGAGSAAHSAEGQGEGVLFPFGFESEIRKRTGPGAAERISDGEGLPGVAVGLHESFEEGVSQGVAFKNFGDGEFGPDGQGFIDGADGAGGAGGYPFGHFGLL